MTENKFPLMNLSEKLAAIPRGNTCPGVNREIIETLLSLETDLAGAAILDVPCGEGEFLQTVKDFFPHCETYGADIRAPSNVFPHNFLQIDASRKNLFADTAKFRIITCISGVMEFDNTRDFFEQLREKTTADGLVIVTNDNLLSVRDRFLYFFLGRFRQYKLFVGNHQPTWKILHLHTLQRILYDAKFELMSVKYMPFGSGEWVWLPFAAIIYLIQLLYFRFSEPQMSFAEKRAFYPFRSLLSRHYVIVCRIQN